MWPHHLCVKCVTNGHPDLLQWGKKFIFMIAPLMIPNLWPRCHIKPPFFIVKPPTLEHDCSSLGAWQGSMGQLTCSYKENACAEEDVVCLVVDSANTDTQPTEHQQAGAEDGEHTGGTNYTCTETGEETWQRNHYLSLLIDQFFNG